MRSTGSRVTPKQARKQVGKGMEPHLLYWIRNQAMDITYVLAKPDGDDLKLSQGVFSL